MKGINFIQEKIKRKMNQKEWADKNGDKALAKHLDQEVQVLLAAVSILLSDLLND